MLDMGFADDVATILESAPPAGSRQMLLFSATTPPFIQKLVRQHMARGAAPFARVTARGARYDLLMRAERGARCTHAQHALARAAPHAPRAATCRPPFPLLRPCPPAPLPPFPATG